MKFIYRIAGKFGDLAVYITTTKLKSAKISYSHKFKSANILEIVILGSTARFNSCQYFQLYGIHRLFRLRQLEVLLLMNI